jgi:hypothetical protein
LPRPLIWQIRMPKPHPCSADTEAMVTRVAPSILELPADDVPRAEKAVVAALAGRRSKEEAVRTPAAWRPLFNLEKHVSGIVTN